MADNLPYFNFVDEKKKSGNLIFKIKKMDFFEKSKNHFKVSLHSKLAFKWVYEAPNAISKSYMTTKSCRMDFEKIHVFRWKMHFSRFWCIDFDGVWKSQMSSKMLLKSLEVFSNTLSHFQIQHMSPHEV